MTKHSAPRIEVDPQSGCWVWVRGKDSKGYGAHRYNGRLHRAHRWLYEWLFGPVPDGLELDHLCRNRACINPAHLQPVLHAENCRRGAKTKLSPQDRAAAVFEMHQLISQGLTQRRAAADIAPSYGVSDGYLRTIYREDSACRSTEW